MWLSHVGVAGERSTIIDFLAARKGCRCSSCALGCASRCDHYGHLGIVRWQLSLGTHSLRCRVQQMPQVCAPRTLPNTFRSLRMCAAGAAMAGAAGSTCLCRRLWLLQRHAVFDGAWSKVVRSRVSDVTLSHPRPFWFRLLCFCDVERRMLSNALQCVAL